MTSAHPSLLRIGTRGSQLARWQAQSVADALRRHHPDLTIELVEIKTLGDRDRSSPLSSIGGAGVFTKEIQRALLDGRVDLAVHSLKDLPTIPIEGLILAAVPARESAFDALIAPRHGCLDALPAGARIGTSSLRRRALIGHIRPDLAVVDLRGNVETRLRQALDGRLDAIILAEAGLRRLERETQITERLSPPRFLPAVGQGALGLECRACDAATLSRLAVLDDPQTHRAVIAERTLLATLQGGCLVPLGAWAREEQGILRLDAAVLDPQGRHRIDASDVGADPVALGRAVAAQLRQLGADQLLASSE
ncbi:MAG: porphobilinogen deaminase [Isosphaeraceae bacterium]|jgi:hydroxymethylbilane synthase|nr:MAG: porphobilinogen deaminase [Isosphaeraceae bacterium]